MWKRRKEATYLCPITPAIPLHRCREELGIKVDIIEPTKLLLIARQHNSVLSRLMDANPIIGKGLGRMEIEHK